ncbi:MAG: hypothetical protein J5796_00065 [Erysipelotrichaceae bacterium]|nr:hypothetical protein [Erysipelotrichaceae bacterium]
MNGYEDIIGLPHFVSKDRKHMSNRDRAAQFAPFAALTGYDESINEAARMVDARIELSEEEKQDLDRKFMILEESVKDRPEVVITYFVPDRKKKGGMYLSEKITIRRIDCVERVIITADRKRYRLDDIDDLDGELFRNYGK